MMDSVPSAIAVDANGDVVVTGAAVNPQSGNSYTDFATIKYSSAGMALWTNWTTYESVGSDVPRSIVIDSAGDVLVTGDGSDTDYVHAYTAKLAGGDGSLVWSNRFNTDPNSSYSYGKSVKVDASGNVFVMTEQQDSADGLVIKIGVAKYNSAGAVIWTNICSESGLPTYARDLGLDSAGNPVISGLMDFAYYQIANSKDFTTIKLNGTDGVGVWTNYFSSAAASYNDEPAALTVSASDDIFVTGKSDGAGSYDYLTIKYTSAGVPVWTNRYDGQGSSYGDYIDAPAAIAADGSGNVYVTGQSDTVMRTIKYQVLTGASQVVTNDIGAVTIAGFVTSSTAGAANESGQAVNFLLSTDDATLFTVQPAISSAGTLTYTVNSVSSGVAIITVIAQDDGGTANGGGDKSTNTFTIVVQPVPPQAQLPASLDGTKPPPISAQAFGSERILRWTGTSGSYVIESAPSVTGPWTRELVPLAQEKGDIVVRLPANTGTRFYRLIPTAPSRTGNKLIK